MFEKAKFGDRFVTEDGKVAIYWTPCEDKHTLIVEGSCLEVLYDSDGKSDMLYMSDIVSKYKEPIDEEKLDKLARNAYKYELNYPDEYGPIRAYDLVRAFKVGYKVAKEE